MSMQPVKTFEELEEGNKTIPKGTEGNPSVHLRERIDEALEFIRACLIVSNNPVCLTSFGKDSLVMLHLIRQVKDVPVIYWREPFFQNKFEHANKIAQDWDLIVHDYPPTATEYLQIDDYFDVYNYYDTGCGSYVNLYTGCQQSNEEGCLCAVMDLLNRPLISGYTFKWDCIFHGHKQSDPVYIADKIDLPRVKTHGDGILALVIKDWTDEDIWEYINCFKLPYNIKRYTERDLAANNDVFPTCWNCLDYRQIGNMVYCPKLKRDIKCDCRSEAENEQVRQSLLGVAYK